MIELNSNYSINIFKDWNRVKSNLSQYRFYVIQKAKVSILTDLKQSFLGLMWLFIVPIIAIISWIVLNSAGIVNPGEMEIPYPAYVLLSTFIWGFFLEIYNKSRRLFSNNKHLLLNLSIPHEILITERIFVHVILMSIPFTINIIVLLYFGVTFKALSLLFPLTLIPLLLLGAGIGLLVSILYSLASDIGKLADEGMKMLMFITPVIYSPDVNIGWLSTIIKYNPLTYLISFSRDLLISGTFYHPYAYLICLLGSLILFIIALKLFLFSGPKVVQHLFSN